MAISLKTAGSWSAALTADTAITIPGSPAAGDRMFCFAVWKAFGTTAQITSPQAWTEITEFADGSVAAGANVGSVKVGAWYRDWVSGDGNPTLDWSVAPAPAAAVIMLWQKAANEAWDTPTFVTAAITAADPWSATSSGTITIRDSSVVMELIGLRDDSTTLTRDSNTSLDDDGSPAITWNGNVVESPATHFSTTTSNDIAADLIHRFVTTGGTGVNLTTTGDPAAAETGAALWVHQAVNAAPLAEVATGTGSALAASILLAVSAALSSGTGAAYNASITTSKDVQAEVATGTGTAYNVGGTISFTSGIATGTGAANGISANVQPTAALGAGTGSAGDVDPTVESAPNIATGVGSANLPSIAIEVNAGLSSGSGTANDATVQVGKAVDAGLASGTGTANGSSVEVGPNGGIGTGTGAAGDLDPAIAVNALLTGFGFDPGGFDPGGFYAGSEGTAYDATVSTATFVDADAEVAAGTGEANQASVNIQPNAGASSGSGTAYDADAETPEAHPGVATGTGTAYNATVQTVSISDVSRGGKTVIPKIRKAQVYPEFAQGIGVAYDATIEWNDDDYALALLLGADILPIE